MEIPLINGLPSSSTEFKRSFGAIVDALFGFSFKGPPKGEFGAIISSLAASKLPTLSIDIPSGWDVEARHPQGIQPEVLVSLTAPKLCSRHFRGKKHFLGGRFVPPELAKKYQLNLPEYPGTEVIVDITWNKSDLSISNQDATKNVQQKMWTNEFQGLHWQILCKSGRTRFYFKYRLFTNIKCESVSQCLNLSHKNFAELFAHLKWKIKWINHLISFYQKLSKLRNSIKKIAKLRLNNC